MTRQGAGMAQRERSEEALAVRARQILEEPMVKAAFEEIESAVVNNIATCPASEVLTQQQLCMLLAVTRKFRRIFESHVETGRLVDFELARKKKLGIF
mgnify:CR=1 FL=1